MSDKKENDSKGHGWNDWASKKNDWDMSNNRRPKLAVTIHKNHMSQSSFNSKTTTQAVASPTGRSGSFRRTNSLPVPTAPSLQKDMSDKFVDSRQEEFDALEAKALAEAAAAIELEMAQSGLVDPLLDPNQPSTSKNKNNPLNKVDLKKNGSSGFEVLFSEEIAAEDVEECMLLASQVCWCSYFRNLIVYIV